MTLYNGDCLDIMSLIPDGSVNMVLADLPYGTTACAWDVVIPFDALWEQYNRVCKPKGVAALLERRDFIGIELDKDYYDIAVKRIGQVIDNPTLPL